MLFLHSDRRYGRPEVLQVRKGEAMKMQRDCRDVWPQDVQVGTFDVGLGTVEGYPGASAHILFVCPNNRRCSVLLGPQFVDRPNPDGLCVWKWDGNMDAPSIQPSINCLSDKNGKPTGGCGWHGFITGGVIK